MYTVVRRQTDAEAETRRRDDNLFVIEDSLGYLVNKLARGFAAALSQRIASHGISIAQWAVLLFLWSDDGVNQRTLSRHVAIDEATMVRTIDRMERDGLVRRERSREDRRHVNIFLTDRGRSLCEPLVPLAIEVNDVATSRLSDSDRDHFKELMRRMITSLETPSINEERESS